jgi:hypothetical protein
MTAATWKGVIEVAGRGITGDIELEEVQCDAPGF